MSEPTNEELRQACEAESALCTRPEDCGIWSHSIARALLYRLDREAEAERPAVKVMRKRQGGIADCVCGETVFDSMRYCPACGKRLDFKEI